MTDRPIRITSVVGKILISMIREKNCYLENHSLIKDSQHGFRNKRSCLSNLIFSKDISVYDVTKSLDVVYLDFHKVHGKFHNVNYFINSRNFGFFDNQVHQWIPGWLSNSQQRVAIDGSITQSGRLSLVASSGLCSQPSALHCLHNNANVGINNLIS